MNNAIVTLTRGYKNESLYFALVVRNQLIKKFVNKDLKYPLVIFHEGNIPAKHQEHIIRESEGQQIQFVDISKDWSGGYEGMCRFYTYHLWQYCKEYDYILRIDEDCHITKCPYDPFTLLGSEDVYLRSKYWAESHTETNATLPQKIKELTGADPKEFYNDKYPYTNISVSSVKFWLDMPILKEIALCDAQRANRWGDLPVLGSLLNIYAKGRVGVITGLQYAHQSHHMTIDAE